MSPSVSDCGKGVVIKPLWVSPQLHQSDFRLNQWKMSYSNKEHTAEELSRAQYSKACFPYNRKRAGDCLRRLPAVSRLTCFHIAARNRKESGTICNSNSTWGDICKSEWWILYLKFVGKFTPI